MAKKEIEKVLENEVDEMVNAAEEQIVENNEVSADDLEDADDDDEDVEVADKEEKSAKDADDDKSFVQICRDLLKDKNNKRINGLLVKKISFDERPNYTQVNITLNKRVPSTSQYATDGKHKTIYTNTFALASVVREIPAMAWVAQHIIDEPEILEQIFTGAAIDIIQVFTPENDEFVNPFSTKAEPDVLVRNEDAIRDFVVGIKLNPFGFQELRAYASELRAARRQNRMQMQMMSMAMPM